ncbi:hypothetical protein Cme02nite_24240 [Catellatospora methionotrophica]|uniref:DUF4192 domain-containing protein n=1 Tax=Catellatospora methionotrophica TaxID=121620 RepID=A0A8J3L890_9ACTN|nr:DUF4192 domain-containing protein [Catellatospora methionotrophica]GIG14092.1 hypothetical protein Cme02nite_24240 [Catellatospora methionotrophica]
MATDSPTYTLTERTDLLGYVPYLLGFHPADSIVVLGLADRRICVAARTDLGRPRGVTVRQLSRLLAAAGRRRAAITSVMLVGYGPDPSAAQTTRDVADALDARGYHVREVLLHFGDRYRCLQCDDCTPPGGAPFDLSTTAAAAIATYEGLVAQPDRASVEQLVRPVGGLAAIAMTQAVDRAELRLTALLGDSAAALDQTDPDRPGTARQGEGTADERLVRAGTAAVDDALRIAAAGGRLDDDEAAWLTVLLLDLRCRDHAWQHSDAEPWQLDLWLDLTRRGEPALLAPMASLLAWCAWRSGQGVLAGAALRRALAADPAYSLAHLLTEALEQGVSPGSLGPWPAL